MKEDRKYYQIKTTEAMKNDVLSAIPILTDLIQWADGNEYLTDIYERAQELLDNAKQCEKFDIWDKQSNKINDWAYISETEAIAGKKSRVEFDEPKELLRICFPTGAYIFNGNAYDKVYYDRFMNEIQAEIKPDYDFWGDDLFYEPEHAKDALEIISRILKKYMDAAEKRKNAFKIEKMEAERARIDQEIAKLREENE